MIKSDTTYVDGKYIWDSNGWINIHQIGGKVKVVDDNTYVKVLQYDVEEEQGDRDFLRVQLDKAGPLLEGPFSVRIPVWLSDSYRPDRSGDGWANLLGLFNNDPRYGRDFSIIGAVDIGADRKPYISIKPAFSGTTVQTYKASSPLQSQRWHILELKFAVDGNVNLFIDEVVQATGKIHSTQVNMIQVVHLHGGAYGDGLPQNCFIRNGPIEIRTWA